MTGILVAASVTGSGLQNGTVTCEERLLVPGVSQAVVRIESGAGILQGLIVDQDSVEQAKWVIPVEYDDAGDYQVRANSASPDTPPTGTMDTWLDCSTEPQWSTQLSCNIGAPQQDQRTFTLDFRKGSSGNAESQFTVTVRAICDT